MSYLDKMDDFYIAELIRQNERFSILLDAIFDEAALSGDRLYFGIGSDLMRLIAPGRYDNKLKELQGGANNG